MWAPEQTSVEQLVEPEDVFGKMVYALVNPVADHLVEKAHEWPGVSSLASTYADRPLTASRPKAFFRSDGKMPETVSLRLHLPKDLCSDSRAAFVERLAESIAAAEASAADDRKRRGRAIVGPGAVLRQHWNDSPQTREPRRQLDPRVACKNTWRRIETLARNKAWVERHIAELALPSSKAFRFASPPAPSGSAGSQAFPANPSQ